MSKSVRFQVEDKAPAAAGPGFKPDTGFRPVDLSHPKLDCSEVGLDGDQELWLMQLPHDFPVGASVEWQISPNPADGFRGSCTVKGVEYALVPEAEALSAELFATPASERGSLVPITRRMTVARCTTAPMTCFGQQEMEDLAVPKVVDLLTLDKQAPITKKKGKQTKQAAVAHKVAEPRGGVASATANKAGKAAAGVGNQQQQQQQQQGQQQGQQQQQQGQQHSESSKPTKDKSAKKAKKRQEEAAATSAAPAAAGQAAVPAAAAEDAGKSSSKKAKKRQAEEAATGTAPAAAAATQVADKSSSKSGKKRKLVAAEQEVVAAVAAAAPAVTPTAAMPSAGVAKEEKPSSKKKKEKKEKNKSQPAA